MAAEILPSEELRGRLDAYLGEKRKPVFTLGDVRRVTGRRDTTSFSMRQWERIAEIARERGGDLREGRIVLTTEGFREAASYIGLVDPTLGKTLAEKRWGGKDLSPQITAKLEFLRGIYRYRQEYPKPFYGPQDLSLATGRSETTHFGNFSSLARFRVVEVARKYGVQIRPYVHWRLPPAAFIDSAFALGPPDPKLQEYRRERARAMHTNGAVALAPVEEFIPLEKVAQLLGMSAVNWNRIKGGYQVRTVRAQSHGRPMLYCLEDIAALKRERQAPKRRAARIEETEVPISDGSEESTDIFRVYDREINRIPVLKPAQVGSLSARLFSAKLALRSLRQIGQVADLPRLVGLRLAEIIEAGTGKYLLEEGDEELRHRSAEFTGEPQDEADIEFVKIVSRYDERTIRKLCGFVDIQDELAREQIIRTFAERQFQLFEKGKQAFNELVEHNLRYVRKLAFRYRGRGVPDDDLIGEGNFGLMKAVVLFDFRRGYKFSTYATWWIRQHISRAVDNTSSDIRIPLHVHEALRKLSRARDRMTQELGREVSMTAAAEGLGVTDQIWQSGMQATNILSLEQPLTTEDDRNLEDVIGDGDGTGVEKEAGLNLMRDEISDLLEQMPARTRSVIEMRYGLKGGQVMTLEQIGDHFGLTRERIRQIEAHGLKWLRHPFRSKRLRPLMDN